MRGILRTFFICLFLMAISAVSAYAAADTLLVGLRSGSDALFSANLQNAAGCGAGYAFGVLDDSRDFVPMGDTDETEISMTPDGNIFIASDGTYSASGSGALIGGWHLESEMAYDSFEEAAAVCGEEEYPAYAGGAFRIRRGGYGSMDAAEDALAAAGGDWRIAAPSDSGITVTITGTQTILFQFDGGGAEDLTVLPLAGDSGQAVTWFKGYRYYGAFQYLPEGERTLAVVNVLPVDDYVKGVIPYEMSPSWPVEALAAQAVCARTYALRENRHSGDGFDVCTGVHCQTYYGVNRATEETDRAVEETAGLCLFYNGELIEAVYAASNGGASEDAENVWGSAVPYLQGKADPYEDAEELPNYSDRAVFTAGDLTALLAAKGYDIGRVTDLYVSRMTELGNVAEITFVGTDGSRVVSGESCRTIFNGVFSGRSVRSQRYTISGGSGGGSYPVNGDGELLSAASGIYVLSESGRAERYAGGTEGLCVATAEGVEPLVLEEAEEGGYEVFTISGTGNGHNVGLSQYGAKAMAEAGMNFREILAFYYTDITIEKVGGTN